MRKALIVAASLGLSISAANACDFMRSAQSTAVDTVAVASIAKDDAAPITQQTQAVAPELMTPAAPAVSKDGQPGVTGGYTR
jgi:hypothetical protein